MKKLIIPIAVFIAFLALYIGFSRLYDNNYLFRPVWDVEHYWSISVRGYEVFPCTPGVNGPPGAICGNPGWFPMWPLAVKLIRPLLGGSSRYAFNYLPQLFTFLGVILIFLFIDERFGRRAAIISILALLFNPAGFYWMTGFPYALMLFLFAGYLCLLYRPQSIFIRILAAVFALGLSLSYPTGFIFAVIPLIRYISENGKVKKNISYWLKLCGHVVPFLLGPLLLFTYFYIRFDDFWLHLHFQEKYHRTWAFPFYVMFKSLFTQPLWSPENLTILWYGLALALLWPYKIRRELWLLALILFLFSLTTGTTTSLYRHYLMIVPVYFLIGTSGRPIWLKMGFVAVGLAAALSIMFPEFMAYRLM
jgi:hypothetical protein